MSEHRPTALILGVTSDIGRAVAHQYAKQGYSLILTARSPKALAAEATDLQIRHRVPVATFKLDINSPEDRNALLDALEECPDVTICAIGLMPDQETCRLDPSETQLVMQTNYLSPCILLEQLAQRCEARGIGSIIALSSVAGDRGRQSNYIYGSAKAGLSTYLEGLSHRMHRTAVHIMTVKPGYVRTKMTDELELPALLTSTPDKIAEAICKSQKRRSSLLYYLPVWRLIMQIIKAIPRRFYFRLRI